MKALALLGALAFVASAFSATGAAADEVLPVPAVTIYPGNKISAEMLADQAFAPGTSDRGLFIIGRDSLVGKVAKRTLLPGKAIATSSVAEPDLVNRGVVTKAVFQSRGIAIATQVMPLQSGALGAFIQVRNLDSGQVISGTVQQDGTVRVAGG